MSTSESSSERRSSRSSRSSSRKLAPALLSHRHAYNPNRYLSDEIRKYREEDETNTPTESTVSTSSLSSSFPAQSIICNNFGNTIMEEDQLEEPVILPPANTTMIEVSKITALVEQELQSQKVKHKEHINRTVNKYKNRIQSFETEIGHLRRERDEARRELENCKRVLADQQLEAERNDRFQSEQKDQIEMLQDQKELFEGLQKERDALLEELTRNQQRQQKTKDELTALKVRVREDSQKRLSVMECLSASWDAEKKEAQQKEALLNSELELMSKTLKAEQEYLKHKNKEFGKLEAQYRLTKAELQSMRKSVGYEKEDLEEDLRRERESRKRMLEDHKKTLKLKNEEIHIAETTIESMKDELKAARANFALREESISRSIEGMKDYDEHGSPNPEVDVLREENSRLDGEVKELQRQVESYLANMALQQEFCDSLKSRIYKEQESEHEQIEQMHKLKKQIKKQQKETAEKDREIEELRQLLGGSSISESSSKAKAKPSSFRKENGERKKPRKSKSAHARTGGYGTP